MDPRFLQELMIRKAAYADHQLFEPEADQKQLKARRKTMQTKRRLELMNMREKRGGER